MPMGDGNFSFNASRDASVVIRNAENAAYQVSEKGKQKITNYNYRI